jgi:hypothetical protein
MSERAAYGLLRRLVFGSREESGEIDTVSRARAVLKHAVAFLR